MTLTGSNFVQGITQASFGAGISVGDGTAGVFGPVAVNSDTAAVAQVKISDAAAIGPRTVTVKNGPQQASLSNSFSVVSSGPRITDFTPHSAPIGTLVALSGNNLAPNPRVTLNRLSGGTLDAPVANATATSIAFVIPAGAATGVITVAVGADSVASASPLTIIASSDFTLNVQPPVANLVAGQSVSFAVSLTSANAFAQLATLDVTGVPPGASASFTPQRITAGQTSVLTFTAPAGQPAGSANLTITASATVDGLPQSRERCSPS